MLRSLFRVHTWGGSVEGVTFTCEPQLAIVSLVLQQLPEFREHLPAVAADQYVRIAYNISTIKPNPRRFPDEKEELAITQVNYGKKERIASREFIFDVRSKEKMTRADDEGFSHRPLAVNYGHRLCSNHLVQLTIKARDKM